MINKTKIKELLHPTKVSSDFLFVFEEKVKEIAEEARDRARMNGRKTVLARDI